MNDVRRWLRRNETAVYAAIYYGLGFIGGFYFARLVLGVS